MATLRRNRMVQAAFAAMLAMAFVGLTAAAARAAGDPPPDFAKLQKDLKQAYDAGNYQKALETAEKMHELKPNDAETMYNMACMHCLLGHKDKAYDWIEKAIDAGFADADGLANDDDFKTIRGEDRFRALVKRLREPDKKAPAKKDSEREAKKEAKQDEGKKEKQEQDKKDQPKKDGEKRDARKMEQVKKTPQPQQKSSKPGKFQYSDQEKAAKVQELTQAAIAASEKKDRYKALAYTLEARVLADVGLTNYNVACMYSLLDQKDDAFRYLERAVELNNMPTPMAQQMEGDTDLDNIRKDARYTELLKKAGDSKGGDAQATPDQQGKQVDPEWQVTVPKGLDKSKKVPLIVALHGYNGNMDETIKQWKDAAEEIGAILLTPQGTFRLSDDHYHWGRNLDTIEENIMAAIDEVAEDHQIDKKKVIIVGFSQGGWAAWTVALRNPDVFCGAIPVGGRLTGNWKDDVEEDGVKKLRIYSMLGADDEEPLLKDNKAAAKQLKEMGVKVEVRTFDGVGHAFPKNSKEEEVKALKFILEN
jgi:predicted esterase